MDKGNPWKVISSRVAYENPWLKIREDAVITPSGSEGIYGVVETKDSVIVAAVNDKNELYFINSYSYPAGYWGWWLPGGGGNGEDPKVAGARELLEETGLSANEWTLLGKVRVSNGLMIESMSILLAQDLSTGDRVEADDTDIIVDGKFISFNEIDSMIADGQIDDGQTLSALYLVKNYLDKQKGE